MEFRQLEAYIKTIELSSFSKAGDVLYISQPSISSYINKLEKELDTKLIIRTTKDVKATKAGMVFYEYAKKIIALKKQAIFSVKSQTNEYHEEIEIHASSVPAQYFLPDILSSFNKIYPNIYFNIIMSDTDHVIANIISQNCEIGIVGAKIDNHKCSYEYIVSESLVMIAPPNSKLSEKNLSQYIYFENFIAREESSATRYHSEAFLKELDIEPDKLKIVACFSDTQSIINAVSKGLGISIVSDIAAGEYIRNNLVSMIKMDHLTYKRNFYFVYKKNAIPSPQVELFIKYACDYFDKTQKVCID